VRHDVSVSSIGIALHRDSEQCLITSLRIQDSSGHGARARNRYLGFDECRAKSDFVPIAPANPGVFIAGIGIRTPQLRKNRAL
jgi:hypothetical protein